MSSLDKAKTVVMEIQINTAGSEFELGDNGRLRSNSLNFIQCCFDKLKSLWQTKHTLTFKTIPNVCGVTRAVVWTLSINARGIRMAFVHFNILAFVNVWKRTSVLYLTTRIGKILISARMKKLNITKSNTRNF